MLPACSPLKPRVLFAAQFCKLIFNALAIYVIALLIACCAAVLMTSIQPLLGMILVGLQLLVILVSIVMCCGSLLVRWLGIQRFYRMFNISVGLLMLVFFCGLMSGVWWAQWFTLDDQQLQQLWQQYIVSNLWWGRESWLWLPTRALLLEPQAIVLMSLLTVAWAGLTFQWLPNTFMAALQQSQHQQLKSSTLTRQPKPFARGVVRNIVIKEWRSWQWRTLIPFQWFLMALLLLPIAALELDLDPQAMLQFTPVSIVMILTALFGTLMASALTSRCIAQDEGTGWLASVPVTSRILKRSKLLAVVSLIWFVLMPTVILVIWMGGSGLMALPLVVGAPASQTLLRFWNLDPLNCKIIDPNNMTSHYRDRQLMRLEVLSMFIWSFYGVLMGSPWWGCGILLLLIEFGLIRWAYQRSQEIGPSLIPY